jgi:hypothetical protein
MLRDPRLWGDDANEFKPERFIAKYNAHAEQLPDVSSIPFGFGRRYVAIVTGMSRLSDWLKLPGYARGNISPIEMGRYMLRQSCHLTI